MLVSDCIAIYIGRQRFLRIKSLDFFAEVLTYQGHIYGTSIDAIRDVISSVCVHN